MQALSHHHQFGKFMHERKLLLIFNSINLYFVIYKWIPNLMNKSFVNIVLYFSLLANKIHTLCFIHYWNPFKSITYIIKSECISNLLPNEV